MSDTESNEQKEKKKSRGALKKIIRVFLMAVILIVAVVPLHGIS